MRYDLDRLGYFFYTTAHQIRQKVPESLPNLEHKNLCVFCNGQMWNFFLPSMALLKLHNAFDVYLSAMR